MALQETEIHVGFRGGVETQADPKAVPPTQLLVLENGVFVFGLLLTDVMPIMVEAGVLLDLFAAVFVMGIVMFHINREFSSLDTARLTALKEE